MPYFNRQHKQFCLPVQAAYNKQHFVRTHNVQNCVSKHFN